MTTRRSLLATLTAAAALFAPTRTFAFWESTMEELPTPQYGLIGQMIATSGQRAALAAILSEGTQAMPGCHAYLIGEDATNADALWIVEVWTDRAHHAASLQLPSVQTAIARGRPMIAGFGQRIEFKPVAPPTPAA